MIKKIHKLKVLPQNVSIDIPDNKRIMTALKEIGVYVKSSCGGKASCGDCVILVKEGAEWLTEMELPEKKILGNVFHITKERLSCQVMTFGDVEVDVSEHLNHIDEKSKISKLAKNKNIKVIKRSEINSDDSSTIKKQFKDHPRKSKQEVGGRKRPNLKNQKHKKD